MREAEEEVTFELVDIRELSDSELDDLVGGMNGSLITPNECV